MEKVIAVLTRADSSDEWCARLRGPVADALLESGPARAWPSTSATTRCGDSLMTMTVLDPPVGAVVSMWTQQCYGEQMTAALQLLAGRMRATVAAYLVTESVPLAGPAIEPGSRTIGFANVALLRRPADMDAGDLAGPLAAAPHIGGDRNAVDVRLHPELGGARPHPGRPGNRGHRRGVVPRGGDHPICRHSSVPPTTTTCRTGWAGWSPARLRLAPTRTSTPCRPAATCSRHRSRT